MNGTWTRPAQFAGTWYPGTLEEAERYMEPAAERVDARAVICPHAGWMYSGRVAGAVYGQVLPPDTAILVGPNHTGAGESETSLYRQGAWKLPEREVPIDEDLAGELLRQSEFLAVDLQAHAREHSLEVQIPFLLLLNRDVKIVPILMRNYEPDVFHDLGRSLAAVRRRHPDRRVLLVASTDMTHYESLHEAFSKDQQAIERMIAVDADGLKAIVDRMGITMCGLGPAAAVLLAARSLGAREGRLVRYATSGDATHDEESVVGYAGVLIA